MFELKLQNLRVIREPAIILLIRLVLAAVVTIVEKVFHIPEAEEIAVLSGRSGGFGFRIAGGRQKGEGSTPNKDEQDSPEVPWHLLLLPPWIRSGVHEIRFAPTLLDTETSNSRKRPKSRCSNGTDIGIVLRLVCRLSFAFP